MLKKIKKDFVFAITQEGFIKIYILVVLTFLLGVFLGALLFNDMNNDCKVDTVQEGGSNGEKIQQ